MLMLPRYPQSLLNHLRARATQLFSRVRWFKDANASSDPQTLLALLNHAASLYPENGVKVYENGVDNEPIILTYPDLLHKAKTNGQKLLDLGIIKPGQIVVVYAESHLPNVLWTWSIITAGAIPAILSPLSNDDKTLSGQLQNIDNMFGSPVVLTPKQLVPKFSSQKGLRMHAIEEIESTKVPAQVDGTAKPGVALSGDLAVILFTSGSTGHSKGVEFTHNQLIESVLAKQQHHPINNTTTFMAWNSFDHSANFCEMHLSAMNVGADYIMLPTSDVIQKPEIFFILTSQLKVGYTFSPNFFLAIANKALNGLENPPQLDFSQLKVLMTGGEATRTDVLAATDAIVRKYGGPEHTLRVAYGLSETCSAIFYGINFPNYDLAKGYQFASAGKHLPRGVEMRIVDQDRKIVAPQTQGRIHLRGSIIFKRYHNNKTATDECMLNDGWFDTGDIGYQDEGGNLIISGRRKEVLILNGNNYSSFELEHAIFNSVQTGLTPSYVASFSVWDETAQSEGVVILFNPTDDISYDKKELEKVIEKISKACVSFCSKYPNDVVPLPRHEMPRSTIGKLSRHKLKQFYTSGAFDQYKISKTAVTCAKALHSHRQFLIAHILAEKTGRPINSLGADSPIMNTGIDSLAYLRIKHDLQKALKIEAQIPLPLLLQADTIEALDEALNKFEADTSANVDPDTIYDPLVVLRKTGTKTPLILCPPGGGEVLNWIALLDLIDDRPIYGLRARGLQQGETRFNGIEETLDAYEKAIRSIQPHGPYAIFGLCFGGILAFELTKRLEASGETVAFCGTIDSPPKHELIEVRRAFKRFMLQLLAFHDLITFTEAKRLENEVYADIDEDPEQFSDRVFEGFKDTAVSVDLDRQKVKLWMNVLLGAIDIVNTHRPEGRIKRFDVFVAGESPDESISFEQWKVMLHGWDELVDSTGYYQVTGNHFNALIPPYVESLADQLILALTNRGI